MDYKKINHASVLETEKPNNLWEDMTVLRGMEHPATKINKTFFVGNEVWNIFDLTIVLKKPIFSKLRAKKILGA